VTYSDIRSVKYVIGMRDHHYIDGKWIDCKSAIPVEETKLLDKQHLPPGAMLSPSLSPVAKGMQPMITMNNQFQ